MFSPGNFGIWQLLLVLLIVVLLFGTKRVRSIGSDLGSALKSFRKGLSEEEAENPQIKADAEVTPEASARKSESGAKDRP